MAGRVSNRNRYDRHGMVEANIRRPPGHCAESLGVEGHQHAVNSFNCEGSCRLRRKKERHGLVFFFFFVFSLVHWHERCSMLPGGDRRRHAIVSSRSGAFRPKGAVRVGTGRAADKTMSALEAGIHFFGLEGM